MGKPNLYVLAGVNGAGKSSIGGAVLRGLGLTWHNPDALARLLIQERGLSQQEANAVAWANGMAQLDAALTNKTSFAFETTLGGDTVREKLRLACQTHRVRVWYCGLNSPEIHVARVKLRVSRGGHDIPREKIFERWEKSRVNLIDLLPLLTELGVFDNSVAVKQGEPIPNPKHILHLRDGKLLHPDTPAALLKTPVWAQAIMERALELAAPGS